MVRQDYAGGGKSLFDTPVQNLHNKISTCKAESVPHITLEDPMTQNPEEQKERESSKQVCLSIVSNPRGSCSFVVLKFTDLLGKSEK